MSVTQVSNDNILSMSAAKLTGAMPAMDGSTLTGIVAGSEAMTGASDPANDTNPADGVGAIYLNTTTGEMFVCTDATTDANEWANVGEGSGDITPILWAPQGTQYGYFAAGYNAGPTTRYDIIERYSFTTDQNASDVGNLHAGGTSSPFGHSSIDYGWVSGGWSGAISLGIQKFSYASQTDSVDHGATLYGDTATQGNSSAASCGTADYAYIVGGHKTAPNENWDIIQKFPYASQTNAVSIGNMAYSTGLYQQCGWSSSTHGYSAGGYNYGPGYGQFSDIEKFSFASEGDGVNCSNLSAETSYTAGSSSTTHGYTSGGFITNWLFTSKIDKMSFSTEATASSIGNLSVAKRSPVGSASTTDGYAAGGMLSDNTTGTASIEKYSHTSDGTVNIIGDITLSRSGGTYGNIQF